MIILYHVGQDIIYKIWVGYDFYKIILWQEVDIQISNRAKIRFRNLVIGEFNGTLVRKLCQSLAREGFSKLLLLSAYCNLWQTVAS